MGSMFRVTCILIVCLATFAWAQQNSSQNSHAPKSQAPPRSDDATDYPRSSEESSSRSNRVDISPPKDDAKTHPYSSSHGEDDEEGARDVQEFHPWDPHKAAKDVEVGDFYFKRKNYRAAEDRYQEALLYKPNDAIANFRLAECQERMGNKTEAVNHYQEYLKILPEGPLSNDAHKALERLKASEAKGGADK